MTDLVKYRMESAEERLIVAEMLMRDKHYKLSISQSYYAIFTAAQALLACEEVDFSKHSAVISYFRREYIKTGKLDVKYSDYIGKAFILRNNCDYADFYIVAKTDAEEQYEHAKEFCRAVKKYLEAEGIIWN